MSTPAKIATATACALFMIAGQAHAEDRLSPDQRATRVRYETLQNPHSTTTEVRRTIVAAANRFRVSAASMLCLANRESNFDERASNGGNYLGLFQHSARYWPSRVRWYNHGVGDWLKVKPHASAFAMRANSLVSARMIRTGGYGPWGGFCNG